MQVFFWLKNLDKHFKDWHPDHVNWINETGSLNENDVAYYEEYIHGKLHKVKSKIIKIEENKKIEFKNLFPMSILSPKGSFIIDDRGKSCIFTATLSIRFGRMFSIFAKPRVDAFKKHIREEGKNLKRILESS